MNQESVPGSGPQSKFLSEEPIFLLGSGQRCGSTLVQRLLNTHPEYLMWGEQGGFLAQYAAGVDRYVAWSRGHAAEHAHFVRDGSDAFIPNLSPPPETIREAARNHLLELYAQTARDLGRTVWGFKEVRYEAHVTPLTGLFPEARVIHLVLNPVDCAVSMVRWEEGGDWLHDWTLLGLDTWESINRSFTEAGDRLPRLLTVRYEDMVADPARFVADLGRTLGLDSERFDLSVFGRRLYDYGTTGAKDTRPRMAAKDLPADVVARLRDDRFRRTAAAYGYEPLA